jgi:hypothetical protein
VLIAINVPASSPVLLMKMVYFEDVPTPAQALFRSLSGYASTARVGA